ncbi:hypothetical protein H4R34_003680 [Dimargaris verticillata]|uniref:Peptidase S8/S53 domain-containing protein n=1 Tax=Dimargaris verticillata TaxID=2761393 RepID=A0A9W8B1N5_9FUNG|nr:hypothetical protein H4R34_003680 [Dimargaris verticillata]
MRGCIAASILALSALALGTWAQSQTKGPQGVSINTVPNSYIVKFSEEPGSIDWEQAVGDFMADMQKVGVSSRITINFTEVIVAAAITFEDQYVDQVAMLPTAAGLFAVNQASLAPLASSSEPVEQPPLPMLAHTYTEVSRVHDELKLTGKGVKVAILDSGLDHKHPAFGNCFQTDGCRIQYAHDFIGDVSSGDSTNMTGPGNPLSTCNPHGTHVAGILAGNDGVFKGVAPDATLGIYRIIDCSGTTTTSAILQALEQAYKDGMDVISISAGTPSGWRFSPESTAVYNLRKKGKVVIAAAGNDGTENLWTVLSPAVSPGALAVASVDLPQYYSYYFNVTTADGGITQIERSGHQRELPPLDIVDAPLVGAQDAQGGADYACGPIADITEKNAIVLVQRGTCPYTTKASNVIAAGGAVMIVYSAVKEIVGGVSYDQNLNLPAFSTSYEGGQFLRQLVSPSSTGSATVNVDMTMHSFNASIPYQVSYFSSWGPSPESDVKPDVSAPGRAIYSSLPQEYGMYGLMDGTSMATPYLAGVAALLVQSKKFFKPTEVYSAIVNSARPILQTQDQYFSAAQQGAGLVQAYRAATTTLHFQVRALATGYTDYLAFGATGDEKGRKFEMTLPVSNRASGAVQLTLSFVPAISATAFNESGVLLPTTQYSTAAPKLTFSQDSLTVRGHSQKDVKVTLDLSDIPSSNFLVVSGYIHMRVGSDTSKVVASVPVLSSAFKASEIPVLPPKDSAYPCLISSDLTRCLTGDKVTYTMSGDSFPKVAFRIQFPAIRIRVRIGHAKTPDHVTASVTENSYLYNQRNMNSDNAYFYAYTWNGKAYRSLKVENTFDMGDGDYVLQFWFFSATGDVESTMWVTPPFTIKRDATTSSVNSDSTENPGDSTSDSEEHNGEDDD